MKKYIKYILCSLVCVIFLSGLPMFAQAANAAPSETDPFVSNHYVDPINQDAPFFDVVLPEIEKNIKENNKHSISPYYDAFPLANNPENFQGLGSTTYANINGKTVTAEAFYRLTNEGLHDPNNGMGLLIYQCIQYKRAHPEEDVKITFSSYRTSVSASVCVIPESKYYGYMRSLYGTNYDEHGFVRISYMLTEAARMGIEVTAVNQLNSYAVNQYDPATKKLRSRSHVNMEKYFEQAVKGDCYEKYAPGKKVADYFDVVNVGWKVRDKTSDMQHIKSASVSHYLATDGTEHTNTVFFSSTNLDDNDYRGSNGNNGSQSGVIVSDHDELYRITYNFMKLMGEYRGQEEMFELRDVVMHRNEEQIKLIQAGKESKIPKDEQIVYLGGKNDPVFELYFTPFGGGPDEWDPVHNPISKYIDKLPLSEDYIEFIWNEAGYGNCHLGEVLEQKIQQAFCENVNVKNKITTQVTDLDIAEVGKLDLGTEIGYRSIKKRKNIHSKDLHMSYVENGERHNVSLMTSCNFYMIAFNSRTNSMLVINETEKTGGNFYEIINERYSYGMIDKHLMAHPANLDLEVGQKYKLDVDYTGSKTLKFTSSKTGVATVNSKGTVTAKGLGSTTITVTDGTHKYEVKVKVVECTGCEATTGFTGNIDEQFIVSEKFDQMPITFRAEFAVEKSQLNGNATLLGSDNRYDTGMSFVINKSGQPRVEIRSTAGNSTSKAYVFKKVNVATGKKVNMTIAIDYSKDKMHCYVDGELKQTITGIGTKPSFTDKHNPVVGGDHRNGNGTYFPGEIYSIAVWSDIHSSTEVKSVYKKGIDYTDSKLMAAYDLTKCHTCMTKDLSGNGRDLEHIALWQDKEDVAPVTDFDYSFAVVGDTQTMCEMDPGAMESLYDWILANKEDQKIKYVIGLGDITDNSTDKEWVAAEEYIAKLNGQIPYSLVRGNHDELADFNKAFASGTYADSIKGVMKDGDVTNSYRELNVQGTKYLIMTIDFGATEKVLDWADKVISNHPKHKVIITTHAYMYRDGTTISSEDCYPPSYYKAYPGALNGDEMWKDHFSKHKNVLMVLSGHDPWQHIVYRQDNGTKGNVVTQMLVDAQYVDAVNGSTAMVAMFYFSNDGKELTVRYYSVEKDCYGSELSQFTINLDKHTHTYKTTVTKDATTSANGKSVTKCTTCDHVKETKTIYSPKKVKLSSTSYTYDGKTKTPTVTVTDSKGNKLKKDKDYTVSYEAGCKEVGKYTVKVTFRGAYSGAKKATFTIKPAAASGISAKQGTSSITLKWKKAPGATRYRVYMYNSSTKKYEKIASGLEKTSYKVTGLKAGTGYKFKIKSYTKVDGDTIWGSYSKVFATATKPKTPSIKSISSTTKGTAALTWSNVSGESGYQVYYATSEKGEYKKVKSYKTNVLKGSKKELKSGKKYYFKVRAYKKTDSGTVYSSWSKVKSIKIK